MWSPCCFLQFVLIVRSFYSKGVGAIVCRHLWLDILTGQHHLLSKHAFTTRKTWVLYTIVVAALRCDYVHEAQINRLMRHSRHLLDLFHSTHHFPRPISNPKQTFSISYLMFCGHQTIPGPPLLLRFQSRYFGFRA